MSSPFLAAGGGDLSPLDVLWEDGERIFCKAFREGAHGDRNTVLVVLPSTDPPTPGSLDRLVHEYELKDDLDASWALRPSRLVRESGRTMLMLEDPGGEPLGRLIGEPLEVGKFLQLAVALSAALGRLHERGLIHKDIKPANVLADPVTGQVWLTGFGIASRLPREYQPPAPPAFIAGTLPYMAPEQTGRMNRSIDSRSDLYSFGITLYEMLTGGLPFTATNPTEWIHCHVARQPAPPHDRLRNVPASISAIIMKLLAKTAEERYQTARGAEHDLQRCLTEWNAQGRIDEFRIGERDTSDRLLIPEKLYGRAREIKTLLAAFDRVVAGGPLELVVVTGYSGIGKSSVVNELHKALVPSGGLFASGKFDQHKRDVPFATLAQAFQSLVRGLLSKSDIELRKWRDAIREALDPNGLLLVDFVPELKHIIGDQPPVPELPPLDAQGRVRSVFRRFIGVFAQPEHPLVLFFDDLQWLDAATLDLLEDLLSPTDMRHLLLIGAYRDNEVDSAHPLMRRFGAMRQAGAILQDIILAPLARGDVAQLLTDSFQCEPEYAAPLAQLVHDKTAGNPFFAIQFISSLYEEKLLAFDHGNARWRWDVDRIHTKGYTDNVVDLMVGKLSRLPIETQDALRRLACMGNRAEFALLRIVYPDLERMHYQLWEAVRSGLIIRTEDSYGFVHDRVQEAAYFLIPAELRPEAHLRIGRVLAAHTPVERQEEVIFDIVNQLNFGSQLITRTEECERTAQLNFIAGRRAKLSTAYASALKYLAAGRLLLAEACWDHNYRLIFSIECLLAECELLTADLVAAENRLSALAQRAVGSRDIAVVTRLRLTLYTSLTRIDRGVEVCLEYLRRNGTDWSAHPTRNEAMREYDRVWSLVGSRSNEEIVDLPVVVDPETLDVLDVLTEVVTPSLFYDENLCSLIICRMVCLSLEHGNSDAACFAYVWFATIAGLRFGNYRRGLRFGRLGYDLIERRGLTRYQARTYMSVANCVLPWAEHAQNGRSLIRRTFDSAYRVGDLTFAAYSCSQLITNLLIVGDPLSEVQTEAENGLAFARRARFNLVINFITAQLALIRMLRGLTPKFGCLDCEDFDEAAFERRLIGNPGLKINAFTYFVRKVQALFLAGNFTSAVDASLIARQLLWTSPAFETAEFRFYGALSHAATWDSASPDEKLQHQEALAAHHEQLEIWAEDCPENFENRAALVGAEIARIQGRALEAEQLYEQSIRSSRANGFVHNEAVANEVAGRFYASRGLERIAHMYLRDARSCYLRWGADGKVKQLDRLYPSIRMEEPSSTNTFLAPVEHLDLATVLRVSQAVSGEIVLERLIDTLMRAANEHAGAERGLLLLSRGSEMQAEAEVVASGDTVIVRGREQLATALPESVVRHVVRAREILILDDASAQTPFSADPYVRERHARSILCLPLMNQTKLTGVLYLENNLTPQVFTPGRIAVLKLLASQAAISLENTYLYRDLAEREAKIRRLVDANIVGVIIFGLEGQVQEANQAFLQMVGYDEADVAAGRVRWTDLTPAEWRDRDARAVAELATVGATRPYEKEYIRKDGGRVPVLIGAATFGERRDLGVAFVVDLTERKRAEADRHESERRYREIQNELAHANRVDTMGQLTASIAHEVKQPIAGMLINAGTLSRILSRQPPNLENAKRAIDLIVRDSKRAADVISRISDLVRKAPAQMNDLAVNQAVEEVIELTRSEMLKNGVLLQVQLADGLPLIHGDRVQLQQVVLNLIVNAIEAMSTAGERSRELHVSTAKTDSDGVLVAVRDTGPGLDPANVERFFDAFYTTKSQGMGMGLSICRGIIEAHGGRLWATTTHLGAVFQFALPASAETHRPAGRP